MTNDPSFTDEEALRAQKGLRKRLGIGDEQFPLRALIGMLSDEIEAMRATGLSDAQIAEAIAAETAKDVPASAVTR